MTQPLLIRLNKVLADAGICSRRKADALIVSGAVTVNGKAILEQGTRVNPLTDILCLNGKKIPLRTDQGFHDRQYIILHKPVQVVSTVSDPQGRPTVLSFLPGVLQRKRLYPVGRLDYFSEGLVLLTNDGALTHRLLHPRYHLPKVYEVRLRDLPEAAKLRLMRKGMTLQEGEKLAPVKVEISSQPSTLLLTLHQGVNRQIRRMCRDLGLTILSLKRVQIGPIRMGDLAKGRYRELTKSEIRELYQTTGLE